MRILIIREGGSYAQRLLTKRPDYDYKSIRICSPGAILAGAQFDLVFIDSAVRRDDRVKQWLETSVACRLAKDGMVL